MTAPVSVSCSKQTKSLTQTGLRSISGIGTDRRASRKLAQSNTGRSSGARRGLPWGLPRPLGKRIGSFASASEQKQTVGKSMTLEASKSRIVQQLSILDL